MNNFNNPAIDDEIIPIIKDLKNEFKENDINFGIVEDDFKKNTNDDNDDLLDLDMEVEETQSSDSNTNIDDMNPSYKKSYSKTGRGKK